MSSTSVFEFAATPETANLIKQKAQTIFDAISIEWAGKYNSTANWYRLTISELALREALEIIDTLQKEFPIPFVVTYGVYEKLAPKEVANG